MISKCSISAPGCRHSTGQGGATQDQGSLREIYSLMPYAQVTTRYSVVSCIPYVLLQLISPIFLVRSSAQYCPRSPCPRQSRHPRALYHRSSCNRGTSEVQNISLKASNCGPGLVTPMSSIKGCQAQIGQIKREHCIPSRKLIMARWTVTYALYFTSVHANKKGVKPHNEHVVGYW